MKLNILLLTTILILGCSKNGNDDNCNNSIFKYNNETGLCENCFGEVGYNKLDLKEIRESKNAECIDLSDQKLVYLLDTSQIENFAELGQNKIDGYNFKGCKFDNAQLLFNDIYNSKLEGADLSKINYGYARIHGTKDNYTLLPTQGNCVSSSVDSINCTQ